VPLIGQQRQRGALQLGCRVAPGAEIANRFDLFGYQPLQRDGLGRRCRLWSVWGVGSLYRYGVGIDCAKHPVAGRQDRSDSPIAASGRRLAFPDGPGGGVNVYT